MMAAGALGHTAPCPEPQKGGQSLMPDHEGRTITDLGTDFARSEYS